MAPGHCCTSRFFDWGVVERADGRGQVENVGDEEGLLADGTRVYVLLVRVRKSVVVML